MRILFIGFLLARAASAQDHSPSNPLSAFNKRAYPQVSSLVLRSAEKIPADLYGFQPTKAVRTFGQLIGHVAESQYMFCSAAVGEKNPGPKVEGVKTSKAELVAALKDAIAYCGKVYDAMDDATGAQASNLFGGIPKTSALSANMMHTMEHYGNLVTYLRLKEIVPPSAEDDSAEAKK